MAALQPEIDANSVWRKLRWLRFNVRALVIAVAIFCAVLGLWVERARRQKAALSELDSFGGGFNYDYDWDQETGRCTSGNGQSWVPASILDRTGPDLFHDVSALSFSNLPYSPYDDGDPPPIDNAVFVTAVKHELRLLRHIRQLDLVATPDATAECLPAVRRLTKLELLECWGATDAGIANLAGLGRLREVTVYEGRLTDESLRVFGKMDRLERLCLLGTNTFTNEGLAHLRRLRRIKQLGLEGIGDGITDAGLEYLHGFRDMQGLSLPGTFAPDAVARLEAAIPSLPTQGINLVVEAGSK